MNYLRLLNLYIAKAKKCLGRDWLYADEEKECATKAKKLNTWLFLRSHSF